MAPSESAESVANVAAGGTRFPMKLHSLLDSAEKSLHGNIISWLPDGTSFKVHDKQRFTSEVLPVFFGTSKYKSFQRNLNLWGFYTVSKGPSKGECSHPLFKRGLAQLCRSMERVAVKGVVPRRPAESDGVVGRGPADISAPGSLQQQLQQSRGGLAAAAVAAEPGRLADYLRQQGGGKQPTRQQEQQAVAMGVGPNPLQLAMLQRLQGNMMVGNNSHNSNSFDVSRFLGLQAQAAQFQAAQQQAAVQQHQQQQSAAVNGVGINPQQFMGAAGPNLAALLQMFPQQQRQPDSAAALNTAMANEAALMSLLGVSAVSRV